jgi:hypothetical protein
MDAMAWLLGLVVLMVAYWLTGTILKLSRQRQLLADILAFSAIILLGLLTFGMISLAGVTNVDPVRVIVVFVGIVVLLRIGHIFSGLGLTK